MMNSSVFPGGAYYPSMDPWPFPLILAAKPLAESYKLDSRDGFPVYSKPLCYLSSRLRHPSPDVPQSTRLCLSDVGPVIRSFN